MNQDLISELNCKQIVHWNARNFTEVPLELLHYGARTEEIYLRWNNIYSMPAWMGYALESLTNLYLEFNKLSDLPEEMSKLKNLQTLHLDSNNFCIIPKPIFSLSSIKCLKMSRNLIDILPKDIANLRSLELLDLSYNLLKLIPSEIGNCTNLREIYLNNNDVLFLPKIMTRLTKLEEINVSYNLLHFLPATPFISRPSINISFNYKLNWCSSQALHQNLASLTASVQSFDPSNRCDSWIIIQSGGGAQFIETTCGGISQKLLMPFGLEICNMKESKVPTLLELSQCSASNIFFDAQEENTMEVDGTSYFVLPKEMHKCLVNGPTAICHVCSCPIFSHSYCALVHSPLLQLPHCLLIFCSRSCALVYYSSG